MTGQQAWNEVSADYVAGRSATTSIDYGPLCPLENELCLLDDLVGDVRDLAVLDAGCGAGENAVLFAKMGATVTAVDFSKRQLAHAQSLAGRDGVDVDFLQTEVETMEGVADASQDLILCTHVLLYVANIEMALATLRRVLRPDGWLLISMDHPIRTCFHDLETSDLSNYPERSYFAYEQREWRFDGTQTFLCSFDRPVSVWVDQLREARLPLQRLLEPPAPAEILDEIFPEDGPLASLRNIPHTLVLVAGGSTSTLAGVERHE